MKGKLAYVDECAEEHPGRGYNLTQLLKAEREFLSHWKFRSPGDRRAYLKAYPNSIARYLKASDLK